MFIPILFEFSDFLDLWFPFPVSVFLRAFRYGMKAEFEATDSRPEKDRYWKRKP